MVVAQKKILEYENQTLTDMSLKRADSKEVEQLKLKIEKQQKLLAEKDHLIETSSNMSSDRDIQSHMDQSEVGLRFRLKVNIFVIGGI